MFRFRKIALAASLAAAALGVSASPAMANYPPAYHQQMQYLKWNPNPAVNPQSCITPQGIYLAAGNYGWNILLQGSARASEGIYLKASNYTWTDCLKPVYIADGTVGYEETTTLTPSTGATARFSTLIRISSAMGSGYYQWGSDLVPHF